MKRIIQYNNKNFKNYASRKIKGYIKITLISQQKGLFSKIFVLFSLNLSFSELINKMILREIYENTDAIVAIDSRGFIFGSAIANKLKKPLMLARKKDKLPGLYQQDYGLEYEQDSLSLQLSSISNFQKFVIVDDLLATGGTAKCVFDLLSSKNKTILGLHVVIELSALEGKKAINCPVFSEVIFP